MQCCLWFRSVLVSLVSWEGGKSCSVVYGSAWSFGHEAHGPSTTTTI